MKAMSDSPRGGKAMPPEAAEAIAVAALAHVASSPVLLDRFLAVTGIRADQIRSAAAEPGFLAGVLRFILAHEPTLTEFAAATSTDPADVMRALKALPHGDDRYEAST